MNLKFGTISSIDPENCLAKVYFEDDDFVSDWLQMSVIKSLGDQFSFPFDINEHVWCIMDTNCEYGVIGGAVYDEGNQPSNSAAGKISFRFSDNTTIEYDKNLRKLSLDIKGAIDIKSTGDVSLNSSGKISIQSTGDTSIKSTANVSVEAVNITMKATEVAIDGILSVTGAANIEGVVAAGGLASITPGTPLDASNVDLNAKSVKATDDVTVGTISLKTHKHTATSGGGPTSQPIP